MKKTRFADSQISEALKRVDAGLAVPDICRELGVSTAAFYKWRARKWGDPDEVGAIRENLAGCAECYGALSLR